jgi:hypothetical protein
MKSYLGKIREIIHPNVADAWRAERDFGLLSKWLTQNKAVIFQAYEMRIMT